MSNDLHHPHDQLFKNAFSIKSVMIDFLSNRIAKDLFERIDQNSLELTNKTFAGQAKLRGESDVIWKSKISGQEGYIYLHCEHQSEVDPCMPLRFLEYNVQLMRQHVNEGHEQLPLILNICVYNGSKDYNGPTSILDMCALPELVKHYLLQDFNLVHLYKEKEADILKDKRAAFAELLLKQGIKRDFFEFLKSKATLFLHLLKKGVPYAEMAILYILDRDRDEKVAEKIATIHPTLETLIMSAAERLKSEGRQEGEKIGLFKGRQEGEQMGVIKGRQEGRQEGEILKAKAIAQSMLLKGCPTSLIAEVTELTLQQIKSIRLT